MVLTRASRPVPYPTPKGLYVCLVRGAVRRFVASFRAATTRITRTAPRGINLSWRCPSCGGDASNNYFDRSLCACWVMHTRCRNCGYPLDGCEYEEAN